MKLIVRRDIGLQVTLVEMWKRTKVVIFPALHESCLFLILTTRILFLGEKVNVDYYTIWLDLCSNFCCLRLAHELSVCLIFGCNVVVQEIKPSFSCSLHGSAYVKDIRWRKKPENSFLALSNVGKLYRGGFNGPLEDVMDNVDAGMYFLLALSMICGYLYLLIISLLDSWWYNALMLLSSCLLEIKL